MVVVGPFQLKYSILVCRHSCTYLHLPNSARGHSLSQRAQSGEETLKRAGNEEEEREKETILFFKSELAFSLHTMCNNPAMECKLTFMVF